MKLQSKCRNALYLVLIFFIASACTSHPVSVLPPDFRLFDMNASEYSAEWWKWTNSMPRANSPLRDLTGENCAVGQSGPVWFLAGGYGSSHIQRHCTVPEGKYLFFPAVNMVYWSPRRATRYTCEQAIAGAAVNNDTALDVFVEIDDFQLPDANLYRARTSECFNVYERVPLEVGAYDAYPSASDGFWFMLAPLPKGSYVIRFGGRYNSAGQRNGFNQMVQNIEYTILVE